MSDQKYFLITKENAEVIFNKVRRLPWGQYKAYLIPCCVMVHDANEVMDIIKDLKAVSFKETEVTKVKP